MPKKRHNPTFQKPASTPHPSLSSPASSPSNCSHEATTSTVNELLTNLRRSQKGSKTDDPVPTMDLSALALETTSHTLHPSLNSILQVPDTPVPRPYATTRGATARQRSDGGLGVRGPVGPPPPRSWLLGGSIHAPAHVRARNIARQRETSDQPRPSRLDHLPGLPLPRHSSLLHLALKTLARDWDWHKVFDQYYLATLPQSLKQRLLAYIAVYGPIPGVALDDLRSLFLTDAELRGATGSDLVTHLDLSNTVGRSISLTKLHTYLSILPSAPINSTPITTTDEAPPDSWDAPHPPTLPLTPIPRFPCLTHLSLSYPLPPSFSLPSRDLPTSSNQPLWPSLLRLLPHLATLTHLSLCHFPAPSLTPNSRTTKLHTTLSIPPVNYSASDLYSSSDGDYAEMAGILRRLSKATYCLKYVDLSGCESWWGALCWAAPGEGVEWNGGWRGVETVVLRTSENLRPGSTGGARLAEDFWRCQERDRGNSMVEKVARFVRGRRKEAGGVYCTFVVDEEGADIASCTSRTSR